jgi:hypothetical protein
LSAELQFKRPLIDICAAVAVLDMSRDQIVELVEDGTLEWSFNVGLSTRRRCIRILSESVTRFLQVRRDAMDFQTVFATILPGQSETTLASKIARAFNVDAYLIIRLLRAGLLKKVGQTVGRQTASVTRQSVREFLKARRVR